MLRTPVTYGALCAALVLAWQALTVQFNFEGDWSALFHTGSFTALPPEIESEGVYRFPHNPGYDGQYYHLVAHDPFLLKGYARFVDNPKVRWRRILVPLMAYAGALGRQQYVDAAFRLTMLVFVFLGAWWFGEWCVRSGSHPAWAMSFVLVPAVVVSVDRSTIDTSLAALCVGFVVYVQGPRHWPVYPILVLAPLARETGAILILVYLLYSAWRREWRKAALGLGSAMPWLAWLGFLQMRTSTDYTVFASLRPFEGLIERTLEPVQYPLISPWIVRAAVLDYLAVLAMWVAVVLVVYLIWKREKSIAAPAAAMFAAIFVVFLRQAEAWTGAYNFGRIMSPLLIWLALIGIWRRSWICLLPVAMVVPRILFQLTPQWAGILRGIKSAVL